MGGDHLCQLLGEVVSGGASFREVVVWSKYFMLLHFLMESLLVVPGRSPAAHQLPAVRLDLSTLCPLQAAAVQLPKPDLEQLEGYFMLVPRRLFTKLFNGKNFPKGLKLWISFCSFGWGSFSREVILDLEETLP